MIDRNKLYQVKEYIYKNFCMLDESEIRLVWLWRNDEKIREWMTNKDIIPYETHKRYVQNLSNRNDTYYWIVYKGDVAIGVVDATNVDFVERTATLGYYLAPELMNSGEGFRLHYSYKVLFFDILDFNRLNGYILKGNTRAFQLTMFMGGFCGNPILIDGQNYVDVYVTKEKFQQLKDEKLLNQFVRYVKTNPVDWNQIFQNH